MATAWQCLQTPKTVRPHAAGGVPVARCVAALVVTALAVYGLGYGRSSPRSGRPTYTATAYVVEDSQIGCPSVSTDDDPQRAATAANALAERCAAERRAQWRRDMQEPCQQAHKTTEKARQDYSALKADLETLQQQRRHTAGTQTVAAGQQSQPPAIDRPKWLDARRKLADLQRQRDQLLIQRTPLHPAVVEIDGRIADAQRRLAAIPQRAPHQSAVSEAIAPPAAKSSEDEARRKLEALVAAVEKSRLAFEQAQREEQQFVQAVQAGPELVVRHAQGVQTNVAPVEDGRPRLLGASLLAGVLMAFGVGLLRFASGIEPPLASLAEVEADLDEPVLGVVPADGPPPNVAAIHRQTRLRRATMALGACLMTACFLTALWGMAG